ncbi:hypothetical protein C8Q72DRAFT_796584 [Fomitopsis betulina]|nr:hypothetical protein C8Q72DRAFT_796584 [Fomitopsis betulina]
MSQADSLAAETALVASLFESMLLANSCGITATTLLFYDYALTFSREIRCIWRRKFTGATVLFLLNRYLFLVYRILMMVEIFSLGQNPNAGQVMRGRASHYTGPIDRDDSSDSAYVTLLILFTSLRMYAIWYKNRKIFGVVLLLGVVPIGVNMFYYTKVTFVVAPPPLVGCADEINMTQSASDMLGIFNCVFAIVADLIVLILTSMKTFEMRRVSPDAQSSIKNSFNTMLRVRQLSYTTLIQRDGTIYFIVLLALNIFDLIAIKYQAFGALPALTEVIYLASDSESNTTDPVEQTIDPQTSSSLVFAAGNLGAPLEDIMSDPEERYVRVTEDEVAYVSEDPLAMGLHSSQGSQEELGQSNEGSRSLKELECDRRRPLLAELFKISASEAGRESTGDVQRLRSRFDDPGAMHDFGRFGVAQIAVNIASRRNSESSENRLL